MQAYQLERYAGTPPVHCADLKAVRAEVKTIARDARDDTRVYLVDLPADKKSVIGYLNGNPPQVKVLRKWRLSTRGRLIEISIDKE